MTFTVQSSCTGPGPKEYFQDPAKILRLRGVLSCEPSDTVLLAAQLARSGLGLWAQGSGFKVLTARVHGRRFGACSCPDPDT